MKEDKPKLNMLKPGTIILICCTALTVVGLVLQLMRMKIIAWCILGLVTVMIVVLFILLKVEERQEKELNEYSGEEDQEEPSEGE